MNNRLILAAGAAMLLGAATASAQGLPFSSDASSDRPWSVNREPPRDWNAYSVAVTPSPVDRKAAAQTYDAQKR